MKKETSMHKPHKFFALLIILLLPLILAACIQPVQVDEAKTAYCTSLKAYGDAVDAMQNLPADATVDDLETAMDAVNKAHKELEDSAWQLADAQNKALDESYNELQKNVDTITDDSTLIEARTVISDSMSAFKSTFQEVRVTSCGS